jgi:hypothetical protein
MSPGHALVRRIIDLTKDLGTWIPLVKSMIRRTRARPGDMNNLSQIYDTTYKSTTWGHEYPWSNLWYDVQEHDLGTWIPLVKSMIRRTRAGPGDMNTLGQIYDTTYKSTTWGHEYPWSNLWYDVPEHDLGTWIHLVKSIIRRTRARPGDMNTLGQIYDTT